MLTCHNTNTNTRRASKALVKELKIVSANVRGFHTNIGELTHNVIVKKHADIVFVSETFLDEKVPRNYARIQGYSPWVRKDRSTQGGGVAFCYKEFANIQVIEPAQPIPVELELLILKVTGCAESILCIGCYRPPSQGTLLFDYLANNLDTMMITNQCKNVILIGDLNQNVVSGAFNTLLVTHDLQNHVTFPTHISGSSLDPVVTDLPPDTVLCSPLDFVGTSDHVAVLTTIHFKRPREESYTRTLWKWEDARWEPLRADLRATDWEDMLSGNIDEQVARLNEWLLTLQSRWVPHSRHRTSASDQPWFGPECRVASDAKYRAWLAFKRHPTYRNRERHREAAQHMKNTQEWALEQWKNSLKGKLRGGHVGSKRWWSLVKEQQGKSRCTTIPPLLRQDGSVAHSTLDKANLLAQHFSEKMQVSDLERLPPAIPQVVKKNIEAVTTSEAEVKALLEGLDDSKAVGPDNISPRLLRRCAPELSNPLAALFNHCLDNSVWPEAWKVSNVVPIHKKNSKSEVKNYRPVSLLPVLSKVLETIVARRITRHFEEHHIISTRQFGFRSGRSAADLHLLLSTEWSAGLDQGKASAVVALDIEGAFDRVWHAALITKLHAAGVGGALLQLLEDYLRNRYLQVTINGQASQPQPIAAGVPQGSCLGPLLWNAYINDLLNLIPSAKAYADDVTLTQSYGPGEEAATAESFNSALSRIAAWGKKWQVKFATHKTQLLNISRTSPALRLAFDGEVLTPKDEVEVLGVTYDSKLTFKTHIERLAREASGKLAILRRISWLLDSKGLETLYKAQVRSSLEFACLAWGGAANIHLVLLDKVQDRATRLIRDSRNSWEPRLQTLQHRRDVAGLTVLFKVQHQREPHLQSLHQPHRRTQASTRSATSAPEQLVQPRCRTWHHQRQFLHTYVGLWNAFLTTGLDFEGATVQRFKEWAHQWLLRSRRP